MYWWHHYWWFPSPWWSLIIWITGIAIIVAIIWIVARAIRDFFGRYDKNHSEAERILDERFARGEITEEEYLRMKKLLRK